MGDSLTAGKIGASYLSLLESEESLSVYNLINAGENGFTMAGLHRKLQAYLTKNETPEYLVLEAGANDLLLPHMQKAGPAWDPFIRKLSRHGSIPASSSRDFKKQCSNILSTAMDCGSSIAFVCTIPCLGENLGSKLNIQREEYNRILRDLCSDYSNDLFTCICIDAALEMKPIIADSQSNWLFESPQDLQNDALTIREKGEGILCNERGLLLTIDGAHLNQRGARLLSSIMQKALRENLSLF